MSAGHKPHIRLMPDEIEALESFAQAHGIPATLDHLGLDGLGNQVNGLIEQLEAAIRALADAETIIESRTGKGSWVGSLVLDRLRGSNPAKRPT